MLIMKLVKNDKLKKIKKIKNFYFVLGCNLVRSTVDYFI